MTAAHATEHGQAGDGVWDGYAPEEEQPPLGSRLAFASVYLTAFGGFLALWRRSGRPLPERIDGHDVALLAGATFKAGRLIAREKVSAPIRAPFTEYQGKAQASGEVEEKARGSGLRAAIGELLICPYCLGMWIVSAFTAGLVAAPRETRLVATLLSALGISDFIGVAYRALVARDS